MRMRKIYALLGKSYPKDPNEPTAKMKNFEYLKPIVGDAAAFDAVFGKTNNTTLSRLGKLKREQAQYPKGSKEYAQYEDMIGKITYKGTGSAADLNTAQAVIDDLGSRTNLSVEEQEDLVNARAIVEKNTKTTGRRNKEYASDSLDGARKQASESMDILNTGGPKEVVDKAVNSLRQSQETLRANNTTWDKTEKKQIEELGAKQRTVNEVTDVINRSTTGDLKNADAGMIDESIQWVANKVTPDVNDWMTKNVDENWNSTVESNIKRNVSLGLLQAAFIKAISGATVTDKERATLINTMKAGTWSNETQLRTALTEFRNSQARDMERSGKQLMDGYSPYDGYRLSQVTDLVEAKEEGNKVVPKKTNVVEGLEDW
jgi:hypothetical protein